MLVFYYLIKLFPMTGRQESKLGMYNAVSTYCAEFAATTATVPAFQIAVTEFDNAVTQLRVAVQAEIDAITGVTEGKANLKTELSEAAATLASSVYAYAVAVNNAELKQKVKYPSYTLRVMRDETFSAVCRNIHNAAFENLANLGAYGITDPLLTAFLAQVATYEAAVPEPRRAVSKRSTHKLAIEHHMKQADKILRERMDKIINQFKAANLNFYNNYKINRVIIDPGASSTQLLGTVKQAGTDIIISNATVLIVEKSLTAVSNILGAYVLACPDPGDYTVKVTAGGYEEKTIVPVKITLGKTTKLDIELTLLPR